MDGGVGRGEIEMKVRKLLKQHGDIMENGLWLIAIGLEAYGTVAPWHRAMVFDMRHQVCQLQKVLPGYTD